MANVSRFSRAALQRVRSPRADPHGAAPTSLVLNRLLAQAANEESVTIGGLVGGLRKRAFGIVLLLLSIVALAPGLSVVAGLLMLIPAFEMIMDHPAPWFPRWIASRPFPSRRFAAVVARAVPALGWLETVIRPRWPTPVDATRRVVGVFVALLSLFAALVPIPLSNVLPAATIGVIALAYVEEDGLLLTLALLFAAIVVALGLGVVWESLRGAQWLIDWL